MLDPVGIDEDVSTYPRRAVDLAHGAVGILSVCRIPGRDRAAGRLAQAEILLVQTAVRGDVDLDDAAGVAVVVQAGHFADRRAVGQSSLDDVSDMRDADRRRGQQ